MIGDTAWIWSDITDDERRALEAECAREGWWESAMGPSAVVECLLHHDPGDEDRS